MTDLPTGDTAGGPTPEPTRPAAPEPSAPAAPEAGPRATALSEPDDRADSPTGQNGADSATDAAAAAAKRRRRGSRGGRNRSRPRPEGGEAGADDPGAEGDDRNPELPDTPREGQPKTVEAADASLVR